MVNDTTKSQFEIKVEQSQQFSTTYEANQAMVFRLCRGYFNGDEALASDAAQEVFIKVWQHLASFRQESSITTWIYRIAVNTCLSYLKKPARRKEVQTEQLPEVKADEYDTITEERLKKMYHCISLLDEPSRIIILMVLEGVGYPDIAEVVGITEDNLRVRIHRIKKQLSNCVQL